MQGNRLSHEKPPSAGAEEQLKSQAQKTVLVYQGTCGWQGQQYPSRLHKLNSKSGMKDVKLEYYASQWPCSEVNTSTYAIPRQVDSWCSSVPKGFIFHFKAYGLFCSRSIEFGKLPAEVKQVLSTELSTVEQDPTTTISMSRMSPGAVSLCWAMFNDALNKAYMKGMLGVVMFQFHIGFAPSLANLQYIEECRKRLDARFDMAVELRNRKWLSDVQCCRECRNMMFRTGISWVSADELDHETYPRSQATNGSVLPIAQNVTNKEFHYIRIHRRTGFDERRLSEKEIDLWKRRIQTIAEQLEHNGRIYVLWGTEHKNVPTVNRDNLARSLSKNLNSSDSVSESPNLILQRPFKRGIKRFFSPN